ncbi:hypothetical protein AVEN_249481-1 [Araneus ventricosus]|uniref:Uncharacterized protein n=1 Tax=Araneus ventricosus TaxID=182803 RepID=A0A4Y2NCM1_ARAVE|nr:hypothetical protein AVEN_249481-1 [Araneus ventricosus]
MNALGLSRDGSSPIDGRSHAPLVRGIMGGTAADRGVAPGCSGRAVIASCITTPSFPMQPSPSTPCTPYSNRNSFPNSKNDDVALSFIGLSSRLPYKIRVVCPLPLIGNSHEEAQCPDEVSGARLLRQGG